MIGTVIADVAMLANSFERNRLMLPLVAELPFTTPTAVNSSIALWKTQQQKFKKANEFKGVKLLGLWTTAPLNILHAKKPISAISDFKNQKIWGFPGAGVAILRSMGAVPVVVPAVKTFNVVSKGIVDGLVIANESLLSFKILPYINHMTLVPGGVHAVSFSLLMNDKKWAGLSTADKDAIRKASGLNVARGARATDQRGTKALAAADKKGVSRIQASPSLIADLRKKLAPITEGWIRKAAKRGIDGRDAIAFYKSQLE
jgi:TRAP-type C4-dicarboxylate transport system substrate-binding protein